MMGIPDPVYLMDREFGLARPITQYSIVLTHFDGTVEIGVAYTKSIERPYVNVMEVVGAAKRYMDTGCYASVKIAPVRTTMDVPTEKAYAEANDANIVLTEPDKWRRTSHAKWAEVK